jgi:hypothetical protein
MRRSSAIVFALALTAAAGIGTPVLADSVVIGGSNSSDVTPFGWDDGDTPQLAFQQLYGASSFGSDPILITQLTFFFDPSSSWQGDMFYVNQQLSLSTSAESHTSPGTSFAANRGADFTQVFSGTFSVGFAGGFPANPCSDCTETELTFNITPFLYDPTAGDLLLEVGAAYHYSPNADIINFVSGSSTDVAVVDNLGGFIFPEPRVRTNYGLLTEFTYGAAPQQVPEPSSLALVGVGLATLLPIGARRRLRRQRSEA